MKLINIMKKPEIGPKTLVNEMVYRMMYNASKIKHLHKIQERYIMDFEHCISVLLEGPKHTPRPKGNNE